MSIFSLRYARALADVAMSDRLDPNVVDGQLREFLSTYQGSRELREVFANPSIPVDSKLKVLAAITARMDMLKQVRNFLSVLVKNERMQSVTTIVEEFRGEIDFRLNIGQAEITTVRELTAEERSRVEAKAEALAGSRVRATYKQDSSLLGGIVLRIGDTIYDGSVRGSLEKLHGTMRAD